jgi:hypothetical protein
MQDNVILVETVKKINENTGIVITTKAGIKNLNNPIHSQLYLKWGKEKVTFDVISKSKVTIATPGLIKKEITRKKNPFIVITKYITPDGAQQLKELGINYADTIGNMYINNPPLYLYIKGNKLKERLQPQKRLFKQSGIKILYALLCNPELEMENYRTIALKACVALGTVNWIMQDLEDLGYLIHPGKKHRKLINKGSLLSKWIDAYNEQLKPKLLMGKFRAIKPDWNKDELSDNPDAYWGEEVGAAIITKYLKPENGVIYANELPAKYFQKYQIRNESQGNIRVYKKFWQFEDNWAESHVVNPILIYADLITSNNNRNIETAKLIYEKEILRFIR